jgi:hypothetical protein
MAQLVQSVARGARVVASMACMFVLIPIYS